MQSFSNSIYLKLHMSMHTGENHINVIVSKMFLIMKMLKYIKEYILGGNHLSALFVTKVSQIFDILKCMWDYTLYSNHKNEDRWYINENLFIHFRVHTGENTFKCVYSYKDVLISKYLKMNMRLHTGEKPY